MNTFNRPNPNPNPNPANLDFPSQLSSRVNELRQIQVQNQNLTPQEVTDFLNEVDNFIDEFRRIEDARIQKAKEVLAEYAKTEHLTLGDAAYQAEKLLGQYVLNKPRASLSESLKGLANSKFKRFVLIFAGIDVGQLVETIIKLKKSRNKYAHPIICTNSEPTDANIEVCAKDIKLQAEWSVLAEFRNQVLKEGCFWKEKEWKRLII